MDNTKLDRRSFIKTAGIVVGGTLLSNNIFLPHAQSENGVDKLTMVDELFRGISDSLKHAPANSSH